MGWTLYLHCLFYFPALSLVSCVGLVKLLCLCLRLTLCEVAMLMQHQRLVIGIQWGNTYEVLGTVPGTSGILTESWLLLLGWPESLFSCVCKRQDTFFIFTNNFIDLAILRMPALSRIVEHWLFSVNVCIWSPATSTGLLNRGPSSS